MGISLIATVNRHTRGPVDSGLKIWVEVAGGNDFASRKRHRGAPTTGSTGAPFLGRKVYLTVDVTQLVKITSGLSRRLLGGTDTTDVADRSTSMCRTSTTPRLVRRPRHPLRAMDWLDRRRRLTLGTASRRPALTRPDPLRLPRSRPVHPAPGTRRPHVTTTNHPGRVRRRRLAPGRRHEFSQGLSPTY